MLINHVMSNDVHSSIFDAILNYFCLYSNGCKFVVSESPIADADIYHYHRPNLERNILPNSVATIHHDLTDTDSWLKKSSFLDRYKECKCLICLNNEQKRILSENGIYNSVVIPHGYKDDLFKLRKKKSLKGRKVRVGFISKRYARKVKGEAYLYELMKRLDPKEVEWVLVGEKRSIDAKVARDLGYSVDVYERLPYRVFGSLYESIDVLLMVSWHEGGPANVPEAIASATPIVGFGVGMVKDFVKDGVNGCLLSGDIDKDIFIFEKLFGDNKSIRSFHEEMLRSPVEILNWQGCVSKNIEVYKSVFDGRCVGLHNE